MLLNAHIFNQVRSKFRVYFKSFYLFCAIQNENRHYKTRHGRFREMDYNKVSSKELLLIFIAYDIIVYLKNEIIHQHGIEFIRKTVCFCQCFIFSQSYINMREQESQQQN